MAIENGRPHLLVTVLGPSAKAQVEMLVATGSPITQLAVGTLAALGYTCTAGRTINAMGLQVNGREIADVRLLAVEDDRPAVLGYNVIRHLSIEINGPKGSIEVH